MRVRTAAALLVLPLALSAVAFNTPEGCYVALEGDPATTEDDVHACELATWLHASDTKVSNLSDLGVQPPVGYDTEAPTQSVQDGAGAGAFGSGLTRAQAGEDTASSLKVAGTFTGPIDVMDFDLHAIAPGFAAYKIDDIDLKITIDGITLVPSGTQRIVNFRTAPNGSAPATVQLDFAITNLAALMEFVDMDLSPEAEHTIEITVQPWFVDSGNWVWVFDTTEVPSAITFNPLEIDPAAAKIPAF